jgi:2-(1,2-epoxy-1,2-dihydrophenyl)acetyl-CoA isomerase
MSYEFLTFEKQDHVGILTLNRPEKLNALNPGLRQEVFDVCDEVRNDDYLRALIITGAGRGFCSGVDLSGRTPMNTHGDNEVVKTQNDNLDEYDWVGRQATTLYRLDKPTIAAVNGIAVGAGMSLALACDLRVGTENTRFRTIFIERAISPDSGLSFFLPRIIGYSRAMDLILTSRDVDSDEALRIGLLDRKVDAGNLIEESVALANQIAMWPPLAVRAAKRVTQQNLDNDLEDAVRNEMKHLNISRRAQNDLQEMLRARAEKRPGIYTGT